MRSLIAFWPIERTAAARSAKRSALAAPATAKAASCTSRIMSRQVDVGTRRPNLALKKAICSAKGRRRMAASSGAAEGPRRLLLRLGGAQQGCKRCRHRPAAHAADTHSQAHHFPPKNASISCAEV